MRLLPNLNKHTLSVSPISGGMERLGTNQQISKGHTLPGGQNRQLGESVSTLPRAGSWEEHVRPSTALHPFHHTLHPTYNYHQ